MYFAAGLFISVTVYAVYRHFTWRAQSWPERGMKPSLYQGHRGYWKGTAQENTLEAFKAAKSRGLKMVEMDVRLSQDGQVVVFHDENLQRLAGLATKVQDLTAAELFRLAKVCTLEDVLVSKEVPVLLNIELKTDAVFAGSLERAVCRIIRQHQAEGRVLFSSFNPLTIWRLSKLLPEVPRALLASHIKEPGNHFYLRHLLFAPYVHAHALHLDHRDFSLKSLAAWKKRAVPVAFWTVNERPHAQELLNHGAFSIISDVLMEQPKHDE